MSEFMTLPEVAEYLRVTKKTVYRLVWGKKVPASRVGKNWRFDRAAIDEWVGKDKPKRAVKILVIDDEEGVRALFVSSLEGAGCNVLTAATGVEGLQLLKHHHFALIFVDLKMPVMDGAELIRRIRAIKPDQMIIIITGYPDSDIMERALAHGPCTVMAKPLSVEQLRTTVARVRAEAD